jgi:hypothetical protein
MSSLVAQFGITMPCMPSMPRARRPPHQLGGLRFDAILWPPGSDLAGKFGAPSTKNLVELLDAPSDGVARDLAHRAEVRGRPPRQVFRRKVGQSPA